MRRPLFVSETGIEAQTRPEWLRYVGRETRAAARLGVEIHGLCWYPIVNHPGWEDDRHCPNGLWDYADDAGNRPIYAPLAAELARQQRFLDGREPPEPSELLAPESDADVLPKEDLARLDIAARDLDEVTTKSREREKTP